MLLMRLRNNDQTAFQELHHTYKGLLLYTVGELLSDRDEAADLVQESFVKIWNSIGSYDQQKGGFVHWMVRIARNTAIDFLRSKYRGQQTKTCSLGCVALSPDWDRGLSLSVDTLDLPSLLSQLAPSYREVIEWTYLRGYTQAEVAQHFDLPLGTVKTRARIGLRELRKIYLYQQEVR